MRLRGFYFISLIVIAIVLSSCHTVKNIPYFLDLHPNSNDTILTGAFSDAIIMPNDLVAIDIQTLDSESNLMFNKANTPVSAIGASSAGVQGEQMTAGYLVDKLGFVDIPLVGKVRLEGLTSMQARDTIKALIEQYYTPATVQVKFTNFKITVLGEVNRPATYIIPDEKASILDALGLAGDLTIFGIRENVILVRDSGVHKLVVHLDLTAKNLMSSPYFFLKKNDVLYVQPSESKIKSLDTYRFRNYTIAAAILSVIIVAATRIR